MPLAEADSMEPQDISFLDKDVQIPQPVGIGEHNGIAYYWSLLPHPGENKLTNGIVTFDRRVYADKTEIVYDRHGKHIEGDDEITAQFGLNYIKPMLDQNATYSWSPSKTKYSIKEFVSGKTSVTLKEAYDKLLEINMRHVGHEDERTHKLMVLKILETYFHKMFHATGKIHIQGEMGSGKTQQTRMFAYYAFNPVGAAFASEAAFRRIMAAISGTLVLDDQDDIGDDFRKFLNRMVKISYTKGMSKAILTKIQGHGEVEVFDLFFPIVTNGILEVDHVAASREFIIYMLKSDRKFPKLTHQQETHDLLYTAGMCNWQTVKDAYDRIEMPEHFGGRLEEISRPVIAIASCIDPSLAEEMKECIYERYVRQMSSYENEDYFFRAITVMLEDFNNNPQEYISWQPADLAMRMIDGQSHSAEKERKSCAYILGRRMKGTPAVFAAKYPNGKAVYTTTPEKLIHFAKTKGWDKYIDNLGDIERAKDNLVGYKPKPNNGDGGHGNPEEY